MRNGTIFRSGLSWLWCLAVLLCAVQPVQSATITVTNTNDSGAGSLRQAILDANPGDDISFSLPGPAPWSIALDSRIDIAAGKNFQVLGPGKNSLSITLSGSAPSGGLFSIGSGTNIAMYDLTFTGSTNTTPGSGGVFKVGGLLTLFDCALTNSSASSFGGAISVIDGELYLRSCDLRSNAATGGTSVGGAVYGNSGSSITITDTTIAYNSAGDEGGGVYADGLKLDIANTTVEHNTALAGGGVVFSDLGALFTMENSIIQSNSANATIGGGLYLFGPTTISGSTIRYNTAADNGGGIGVDSTSQKVTLRDCFVSSNTATSGDGGGAFLVKADISGCTFQENQAGRDGGGIYAVNPFLSVLNSTFEDNRTARHGGGLMLSGNVGTSATLSYCTVYQNLGDSDWSGDGEGGGVHQNNAVEVLFRSSIVANNWLKTGTLFDTRDELVGTFTSKGYNLIGLTTASTSGFTHGVNNDQVGGPTYLDPLVANTATTCSGRPVFTLQDSSPALNAGGMNRDTNGTAVSTDQCGSPRSGLTDTGAWEKPGPGTCAPRTLLLL